MVTRTITTTTVTVNCANLKTNALETVEVVLPNTYKSDNDILKVVTKLIGGDTFKPVAVLSAVTNEILYGMTEVDFIRYSTVLPPRTKKATE
jgi:hypothetical protein